jgi:hypothetical protein
MNEPEMIAPKMIAPKMIGAVQGAASSRIQALFQEFAASLRPGLRIAGLVEEPAPANAGGAGTSQLRSLADGRIYPIFQELGPSSTACGLDAESVVTACEAVRRDLGAGCDLLVLSKFGKLEAERTGLADAFAAGVATQTPILTSVSPKYELPWRAFAAPLFVTLPADLAAIRRWWDAAARG